MRRSRVERGDGALDLRGVERAAVDDRIEFAAAQGAHVAVAIADEALDLGKQTRAVPPAIQHSDRVAARQRGVNDMATEEDGAAEDEEAHGVLLLGGSDLSVQLSGCQNGSAIPLARAVSKSCFAR